MAWFSSPIRTWYSLELLIKLPCTNTSGRLGTTPPSITFEHPVSLMSMFGPTPPWLGSAGLIVTGDGLCR